MRVISNAELRPVVGMREVMQAYEQVLREYYRGDAVARPRIDVWSPTSRPDQFYQWGTMEGLSRHFGVFVTRMKSDIAYFDVKADGTRTQEKFNTRPGLYCGLLWAFSIETGTPLAIIQDGYLQHLRVAAKAGLAAREAALPNSRVVGMLGSGGMARDHLRAFVQVRPIELVRVYSPTPENRQRYASEMAEELGIQVEAVDSPRAAVDGAEIIACCTSAIEPVLQGPWIADGAFISVVKGHAEIDDSGWARMDHVLNFENDAAPREEREHALDGPQALSGGFKAYVAGQPEDYASLPRGRNSERDHHLPMVRFADVLEGRTTARSNPRQVIGMGGGGAGGQGLQFAAVAGLACQLAEQHNLGHVLPDEWFLQTERN